MSKQRKSVRARTSAKPRKPAPAPIIRVLPPWLNTYQLLPDEMRHGLDVIITATARVMQQKDGE